MNIDASKFKIEKCPQLNEKQEILHTRVAHLQHGRSSKLSCLSQGKVWPIKEA